MGLVLLALLLPLSSQAAKIQVEFDLAGSSVSVLGGFIDIPPDGSVTSGSAQLEFQALGSATPIAGPAKFKNAQLAGTIAKSGLGVDITGAVGMTQPGTGNGNLTAGLSSASFNPFLVNFTGFANCANTGSGSGCTVLGLPTTFTGPKLVSLPSLGVGQLASVGNATLQGTFTFTLGGFTAVLDLVGSEVSRTFIPEPNTFGLLALGLAGVAVIRRQRVRRR
jgi:hypothetical protein